MPQNESWIIAGGSLNAFAAAYWLIKQGAQVHLIAPEKALGGVNRSFDWRGFKLDFGCHLFGNEDKDITTAFHELMGGNMAEVDLKTASFTHGWRTDDLEYPDLTHHPMASKALLELLEGAVFPAAEHRAETLFDWMHGRYGPTGAELLNGYLEKMTLLSAHDLAASTHTALPVRRVRLVSDELADLLKQFPRLDDLILRRSGADALRFYQKAKNAMTARAFYPAEGGMGGFTQSAMTFLKDHGVEFHTTSPIAKFNCDDGVCVTLEDGTQVFGSHMIWTQGAAALAEAQGMDATPIKEQAHHVPMVLYYFDVAADMVSNDISYIHNFDRAVLTFRASFPHQYGAQMPDGRSLVCVEAPSKTDRPIWQDPNEQTQRIFKELIDMELVAQTAEYDDCLIKQAPVSYRFAKTGFAQAAASVNEYLSHHSNVYLANEWLFGKSAVMRTMRDLITDRQEEVHVRAQTSL